MEFSLVFSIAKIQCQKNVFLSIKLTHAFSGDNRFKWHLPVVRTVRSFPFLPHRRLHNEAKKPKAGLSSQLSVVEFQRARTPVRPSVCVNRIRVRKHAGATWRRNAWWCRQPAGGACWTGTTSLWAKSRAISSISRSSNFIASRKKNYPFLRYTVFTYVIPIEISKNRKTVSQHGTATWKSAKPSNLRCLSAGCY